MSDRRSEPLPYEPPRLVALGSVHDLTQSQKTWGDGDGDWFIINGTIVTITNAS